MKEEYKTKLDKHDTVIASALIKAYFERQLIERLSLTKIGAPLFVSSDVGVQDDLASLDESVSFISKNSKFEIVHSLAKWKRIALKKFDLKGIITDMKAIRKDETIDSTHSFLVDQWDWEKTISQDEREIETLIKTVTSIYKAIRQTSIYIKKLYPVITFKLPKTIYIISSQELEDMYSDKTPDEREYLITKEKKAVFIIGIGSKLKSGVEHDLRSPDYDSWQLNGDLLIYDPKIDKQVELSSMGIRVDKEDLLKQLDESKCMSRMKLEYHQMIIENELPLTIGGGIGQSRLCKILLEKKHISEVQASYWPNSYIEECKRDKIEIL